MKETYTIPMVERETVEKAIAKFQRKATAYGKALSVEYGEPYAKERTIYELDDVTNCMKQVDTEWVEVFDLTIDSEVIRKDGYSVVAKLEHLKDGNFVQSFVPDSKATWGLLKPICEHCRTKHYRKNTFIVRNEDGTEKQVGSTCLKDYCGIDPQHFAALKQLEDLLLNNDIDSYSFGHAPVAAYVYPTLKALALASRVNKKQGYVRSSDPGSNKTVLFNLLTEREEPTEEETAEAERMKAVISVMERDDSYTKINEQRIWFCNSIKPLVNSGYCKDSHLGYIAYAPVLFAQYETLLEDEEKRKKAHEDQAAASDYIGEIGDKIDVDIESMDLLTSWQSDWGYTYLYKIIDKAGNVMIWYASRCVETFNRMKATVKAHNERDGVKQTIVTRCRAC